MEVVAVGFGDFIFIIFYLMDRICLLAAGFWNWEG